MLTKILAISAIFAAIFSTPSLAGEVEEMIPQVSSGELRYDGSKGEFTYTIIDARNHRNSEGTDITVTEWGNRTRSDRTNGVQTWNPDSRELPTEPMYVGLAWEESISGERGGRYYHRTTECEVEERADITIAAGTFRNAWKVGCKIYEDRLFVRFDGWFSERGRIKLRSQYSGDFQYRDELQGASPELLRAIDHSE